MVFDWTNQKSSSFFKQHRHLKYKIPQVNNVLVFEKKITAI